MFNNDMNNDFNQGVKPLFENDFNNPLGSGDESSKQTGNLNQQNFMNSPFSSTLKQFDYQPLQTNVPNGFSQSSAEDMSSDGGQTLLNSNLINDHQEYEDVPPNLGEIKNLSDATITHAPTMDVLDPMNVMPASVGPQDPIDSYENGNLNNFNNPYNFSVGNETFTNEKQSLITNNPSNFEGVSNLELTNNTLPNNDPQELLSKGASMSDLLQPYDNNAISQVNVQTPDFLQQPNSTDNFSNIQNESFDKSPVFDFNEPSKDDVETVNDDLSSQVENKDNEEYKIIQDDNLNKAEDGFDSSNSETENAYDEPDTLDILEISDEEASLDKENKTQVSLNGNVERIKDLIEELKKQGVKIELEEFDFEKMYQLIIKIEK